MRLQRLILQLFPLVLATNPLRAVEPATSAPPPLPATGCLTSPRTDHGKQAAAADTIWWGFYEMDGAEPYAVEGGVWTWDHAAEDNLEGWRAIDYTVDYPAVTWWERMTRDDFECPDGAPMLSSTAGQLWVGKQNSFEDQWHWFGHGNGDCDLGYANDLCQRIDSPAIAYAGGDVGVTFDYFSDCEDPPYDATAVQVLAYAGQHLLDAVPAGRIGGRIGGPADPAVFSGSVPADDLPSGVDAVGIRLEFTSDGGWSDQDGLYDSAHGPFAADNVVVSIDGLPAATYDFDLDDEGWTPSMCPGTGDWMDVHPVTDYQIFDPECGLSNNVMSFHDMTYEHPSWQRVAAVSPIVDRRAYPPDTYDMVFATWDQYAWLPLENGVLCRAWWMYYPYTCEYGVTTWWYWGTGAYEHPEEPICEEILEVANPAVIPGDADYYRLVVEVISCCECFGVEDCHGVTNATPLIDNVRVGLTSRGSSGAGDADGPAASRLHPAEPNPFEGSTAIRFSLATDRARLSVYDLSGRLVARLVDGSPGGGAHVVRWDGRDRRGRAVAAGVYLLRLEAGEDVLERRVVRLN